MHVKITSETENHVLSRKDIKADVDFAGGPTPKAHDVAATIAREKGVDVKLVEITQLLSSKGRAHGTANAKVWHSEKAKERFAPHKRKKQGPKPEEGAAPEVKK